MFIDYAHKLLCLDETSVMRESVRGEHIPLVTPQHPESELPFAERLVVSVHLSGAGTREILLQLDSGSDGPVLYAGNKERELKLLNRAMRQETSESAAQRALAVLPPQDMRIGSRILSSVSFVTPVSPGKDLPSREEDGVLPTLLFQRVFISASDHFVVFDSR
jgi:hypothetical protein